MYECLIEVCCHQDRVDDALEVFDHLKDAGARVGTVTLAFLEFLSPQSRRGVENVRRLRADARPSRRKLERHLAKPSKLSHHVGASLNDEDDASDIADEAATDGLEAIKSPRAASEIVTRRRASRPRTHSNTRRASSASFL